MALSADGRPKCRLKLAESSGITTSEQSIRGVPSVTPALLTVAETSALLHVSKRTVRRLVADRRLVAHRPGRLIRVDASSVARLLEDSTASASQLEVSSCASADDRVASTTEHTRA